MTTGGADEVFGMRQRRRLITGLVTDCAEITDQSAFSALSNRAPSTTEYVVQGLDLEHATEQILRRRWQDTTFLGCQMLPEADAHIHATGGVTFPPFDRLPYNPYRGSLYTPSELRTDDLDRRIHEHQHRFREMDRAPILEALAQRIHDHAIDDALHEHLRDHERVVVIMGGHALHRDSPTYRTVAIVARELARRGFLVVTGGGPGAMEAGNLGAWLAPHPDDAIDRAVAMLGTAVDYSTPEYAAVGLAVVNEFAEGSPSLAVPTWFYGHEPTNDFATHVAKYFSNSIREDGLLAIATHGVVYTPGAAGTVQEVFMDATQNHYGTFDVISPMVFVDTAYWADDRLAAPLLLRQLAADRPYAEMIAVLDDPAEVIDFIVSHPPRIP